jgi:hypothetical protein
MYLRCLVVASLAGALSARAHASNGGLESDLVGWATGGYHGSAWFGGDRVRLRIVKALFYTPSFLVPDGFDRHRNDAWEFFIDTAWRPRAGRFDGLWTGVGLELYDRSIRDASSGTETRFDALELAFRAGYIWRPFGDLGLYVNPWVGLNVRLTGADDVSVATSVYEAPRVAPLGSVKLGYQF